MIPILYPADVTAETFQNTNGQGRLSDCISAKVEEELNGEYVLTFEYPMTGARYSDIAYNKVVGVVPFYGGSKQAFRIVKLSRPIGGIVTVTAYHVSYDLSMIPCMPIPSTYGVGKVFQDLKTYAGADCAFEFQTDMTSGARYSKAAPSSMKSTLGGVSGSILDIFGGSYLWDNWTVNLLKSRGQKKNITIRYGKDLTDLTQEETIESMYTGCCPYWSKTQDNGAVQVVTLPEKIIESEYAANYPNPRIEMLDLTSYYDTAPLEADIRNVAKKYIAAAKNYGVPQVSIKISFVDLRHTTEYANVSSLEGVNLGDTITVKFDKLGVSTTAKVAKTTWNVLEESYDSVELGEVKSGLADSVNSALAGLQGLQTTIGGTTTRKTYTNVYADGQKFTSPSVNDDEGITVTKWFRSVTIDQNKMAEYQQFFALDTDSDKHRAWVVAKPPSTVAEFYTSQMSLVPTAVGDYTDADGVTWPVMMTEAEVVPTEPVYYQDEWQQDYFIDVRARFWKVDTTTGTLTEILDNPLTLSVSYRYTVSDAIGLNAPVTDRYTTDYFMTGIKKSQYEENPEWHYVKLDDIVTEYKQETSPKVELAMKADLDAYVKDTTDVQTALAEALASSKTYSASKTFSPFKSSSSSNTMTVRCERYGRVVVCYITATLLLPVQSSSAFSEYTIPSGFRPSQNAYMHYISISNNSNKGTGGWKVDTSGGISIYYNTNTTDLVERTVTMTWITNDDYPTT